MVAQYVTGIEVDAQALVCEGIDECCKFNRGVEQAIPDVFDEEINADAAGGFE